jgi:LmbE family N-acetylglucosaminyl deacetylase
MGVMPRPPTRRRLIDIADSLTQALWRGCFAAIGFFTRAARRTRAIQFGGARAVLVLAPHPDDEALGCGIAIRLHRRALDPVTVVIATDGGRSARTTPVERAKEATRATQALGADCIMLALPEGQWQSDDGAGRLRELLLQLQPDIVYAPSCVDYHPEHVRVASALASAFEQVGFTPIVRIYEVGVPLTRALVNRITGDGGSAADKHTALAAYVSQARTIGAIKRLHDYNRVLYARNEDVELFWEMMASDYVRTVRWMEQNGGGASFHGVRGRAFRDPLCYLVGLATRQQLARVAHMQAPTD